MTGTIHWFNVDRCFGFIHGDDGGRYFFHWNQAKGLRGHELREGLAVSFDIREGKDGKAPVANNVRAVEG